MLYYLDSTVNTDNPKGDKVEDRDNSEIGIYTHARKCSPMAHTACDSGHTHTAHPTLGLVSTTAQPRPG